MPMPLSSGGRRVPWTTINVAFVLAGLAGILGFAGPRSVLIFLPGTQPGTVDSVEAGGVALCSSCHSTQSPSREVNISRDWSGSMMAHSARDPLFYAALAIANKYSVATGENTGEYCIRCHSPTGWLAGRSEDITAQALRGSDFDGVQCDYCHRVVDPMHPDSTVLPGVFPVPGYGNGMHLLQTSSASRRGPRDIAIQVHPTVQDTFQASSALCGVCHDVSNPFQTEGSERIDLPPHAYAPMERTYSEWLMSDYPSMGVEGSCQGCHMKVSPGYSATNLSAPFREDLHSHDMTGGNTFVPRILHKFWPGLDTAALARGVMRAEATLRRAAMLGATGERSSAGASARIRITNLTGHKLPTGYPEGRRMWLSVSATGITGDTVFASGVYDISTATLRADPFLRTYEALHGLTGETASTHGLEAGASLFFSLNDTILFDNRIPPKGFTNAAYSERLAAPVGVVYADGAYWDEVTYPLPMTAVSVTASLWYQTASREYIEFLRDENDGNIFDWNAWGAKLYSAWDSGGRSAPVLMDSISILIPDSGTTRVADDPSIPDGYRLFPPWPNPFNSTTTLLFSKPGEESVTLDIFDIGGRHVRTLHHGRLQPGRHMVRFEAGALAGGVYIVRLTSATFSDQQKILLIR